MNTIAKWYNLVAILCQKNAPKNSFSKHEIKWEKSEIGSRERKNHIEKVKKKLDRSYRSDDSHSWKTSKLRRLNSVVYVCDTHTDVHVYLFFRTTASFQSCARSCEMRSNQFHSDSHKHTEREQKKATMEIRQRINDEFFSSVFSILRLKMTMWRDETNICVCVLRQDGNFMCFTYN